MVMLIVRQVLPALRTQKTIFEAQQQTLLAKPDQLKTKQEYIVAAQHGMEQEYKELLLKIVVWRTSVQQKNMQKESIQEHNQELMRIYVQELVKARYVQSVHQEIIDEVVDNAQQELVTYFSTHPAAQRHYIERAIAQLENE
jgi:hypothetical protein